jgi:hypothetical protein
MFQNMFDDVKRMNKRQVQPYLFSISFLFTYAYEHIYSKTYFDCIGNKQIFNVTTASCFSSFIRY